VPIIPGLALLWLFLGVAFLCPLHGTSAFLIIAFVLLVTTADRPLSILQLAYVAQRKLEEAVVVSLTGCAAASAEERLSCA
jgi:hypothetical protein